MDRPTAAHDRRTGVAALAAGALLFASVAAEIVHPVQRRDGTVLDPALFAVYLTAWSLGAAALVVALVGLGTRRPLTPRPRRSGRVGRLISLAGAVLLLAFGLVVAATGVGSGKPVEVSFIFFGVGLLLCAIGHVTLSLGLRRSGLLGSWWPALTVAGVAALVAVVVFADPWHDVALFTFDAAWAAVGGRLIAGRNAARSGSALAFTTRASG